MIAPDLALALIVRESGPSGGDIWLAPLNLLLYGFPFYSCWTSVSTFLFFTMIAMKNLSIDDLCSIFFCLVLFHLIENIFVVGSPRSLAKDFAIHRHRSQQWPGYSVA